MHRQKASGLIDWKSAVRARLDMKVPYSGIFFVEKENIARKCCLRIRQLMRMCTSADHLHLHPLRMRPRAETEADEFSILRPSTKRSPDRALSQVLNTEHCRLSDSSSYRTPQPRLGPDPPESSPESDTPNPSLGANEM